MDNTERAQFHLRIRQFLLAGTTGTLLMAGSMLDLFPRLNSTNIAWFWVAISIFTLIIMYISGGRFFSRAWRALFEGRSNMNTLISLGTGSAWLYSTLVVVFPSFFPPGSHHVYFESALIVIALINLGAALETRARSKTSSAIKKLLQLTPKTARLVRGDQELDLPIGDIQIDDLIRVRPGENIPVDGVVIEGESHVDEAMLTGEPMPKAKTRDDIVHAGTTNESGSFIMRATAIGEQTVLAKIIEWVQTAQTTKPRIAKLTDRVASIFVPLVVFTALITAAAWYLFGSAPTLPNSLSATCSVLLIACPCALGLATPISIIAGIGKGAEYGILIRNGEALQRATELTTIVFDKTGTLTEGQPVVMKIYATDGHTRDEVLQIAASVEQGSEHPWAQAILNEANHRKVKLLPIEKFTALPGKGVQAHVKNNLISIGNISLMHEKETDINMMLNVIDKCAARAYTPTFVARGKKLLGIIALADPIKKGVKPVIKQLQRQGISVMLLTGDNHKTALAVAEALNITQVISEVLPDYKAQKIVHLQQRGEVVGMVGDGINDAPALAQADVGFALSSGTDIAISSADITLLSGKLNGVNQAMQLSAISMRNIRQNLFGAFIYNILSIPIAAGVLYPWYGILLSPMMAGAAMAASSLTVVLNANRLRNITFREAI